jgi:hypothetical protein
MGGHEERHDVHKPACGVDDGCARDAGRVDVPARKLGAGDRCPEICLPLDLTRRGIERVHRVALGGDKHLIADEQRLRIDGTVERGRFPRATERPGRRPARLETGSRRVAVVRGPGRAPRSRPWGGGRGRSRRGLRLRRASTRRAAGRGDHRHEDEAGEGAPSAHAAQRSCRHIRHFLDGRPGGAVLRLLPRRRPCAGDGALAP